MINLELSLFLFHLLPTSSSLTLCLDLFSPYFVVFTILPLPSLVSVKHSHFLSDLLVSPYLALFLLFTQANRLWDPPLLRPQHDGP